MSLLSLEDLVSLERKTALHEISVSLLAEYYLNYLVPNTYVFELENGVTIDLIFKKNDFCHLIGVQQIARARYNNDVKKGKNKKINTYLYSGKDGFKRALDGKAEFSHLANLYRPEFQKQEKFEKFNFFHLIHRLLESTQIQVVNFVKLNDSDITCEFIFHDEYDQALLHLGIEQQGDKTRYFPKTFFGRYLSTNNHDKFITGQTSIAITKCIINGIEK